MNGEQEKNSINEIWNKSQKIIEMKYKIIKEITDNTSVIGEYIENVIRIMVKSWVYPFAVSSGTVLFKDLKKQKQIDGIVWERHRAPVLLEEGNFAAVLPDNVKGIIEIKAYAGSKDIKELQERLDGFREDINHFYQGSVMNWGGVCGVIIRSPLSDDSEIENYEKDKESPCYVLFKEKDEDLVLNDNMLWKFANFVYDKIIPWGDYWRPSMKE